MKLVRYIVVSASGSCLCRSSDGFVRDFKGLGTLFASERLARKAISDYMRWGNDRGFVQSEILRESFRIVELKDE